MANMNGVGLFWNSTNWAFNCLIIIIKMLRNRKATWMALKKRKKAHWLICCCDWHQIMGLISVTSFFFFILTNFIFH